MASVTNNRRLAQALIKTISRLEADPSIDHSDPAFIHLKCSLMQRLLNLELDSAEIRNSIHLVEALPTDLGDDSKAKSPEETQIA